MKQTDLCKYLNNEIAFNELREGISQELEEYEEQSNIVGSSVPINVEIQNKDCLLSFIQLHKLLTDFVSGEIGLIELQYISDCIQLSENIFVENHVMNDWIFEMSDPEINGEFTKERAKEIIEKIKAV